MLFLPPILNSLHFIVALFCMDCYYNISNRLKGIYTDVNVVSFTLYGLLTSFRALIYQMDLRSSGLI